MENNNTDHKPVIVPAASMRKAIAEHMVKSWTTSPKCDYLIKINAEPLLACREAHNQMGNKISLLCIVMKAAAQAIKEFPYINSSYDFEKHLHILHQRINIGFAMSTGDGLLVLNVKDTDKHPFHYVETEIKRLVDSVRNRKLNMDDMCEGTFTINNMGAYPQLQYHNAIINQPELAIFSIYRIREEPLVINGRIAVGKIMNLVLSADHRVIDGEMACKFLDRIGALLEAPGDIAAAES